MILLSGLESEIPQEELAAFDNGRYEEIVQMLSDLGYLTISDKDNQIVNRTELFDAVSTFRTEAVRTNLLKACTAYFFPLDPVETPQEILTTQEFNLIQLLVGLDGDFCLKEVPQSTTQTIFIRVFHYRLNLLGLYNGPIGNAYSASTEQAWTKFQTWLDQSDETKALELSGDLDQLIRTLKENPTFKNTVLYFTYHSFDQSRSINRESTDTAFGIQLGKNIKTTSNEFRTFKKYAGKNSPDLNFLLEQCESDKNKFMLRIMQLHQWMSGYYLGTIDGDIGEISFNSFIELAKGEVENGNIKFSFPLFVMHLTGDYWIVNIHYFFDHLQNRKEDQTNIDVLFREFNNQYEKLSHEDRENVDINLKAAWKEINVAKNRDLKSTKFRFRRIYFGIRSLVRSAWRSLKRLFGWLTNKATEFIKNMADLMKNFAKLLYREIREGLQLFASGMAFLFGNRTITTGDFLSHYDFDADSIHLISLKSSHIIVQQQIQTFQHTVEGLDFAMTLTGRLVRVILLTQGIGWRRVLIEAGIICKSIFKDIFTF